MVKDVKKSGRSDTKKSGSLIAVPKLGVSTGLLPCFGRSFGGSLTPHTAHGRGAVLKSAISLLPEGQRSALPTNLSRLGLSGAVGARNYSNALSSFSKVFSSTGVTALGVNSMATRVASRAHSSVRAYHHQRQRQARIAFDISMVIVLVGVVVFVAAVVQVLRGSIDSAVLTVISGIVIDGLGALGLLVSREANNRLDKVMMDAQRLEFVEFLLKTEEIVLRSSNKKLRNQVLQHIRKTREQYGSAQK